MRRFLLCATLFGLASCTVGPNYKRPLAVGATPMFKEAPPGWTVAQPADNAPKGEWWSIYHDPLLSELESRVIISNQTVRQYEAQLREAQATVDVARSALFPTLNGTAGVTRSFRSFGTGVGSTTTGTGGTTGTALGGTTANTLTSTGQTTGTVSSGTTTTSTGSTGATSEFTLEGTLDWDLDVWGRIRRQIESDVAAGQVSAADLVNATLSAQATLATDYFELRYQDALDKLLTDTVKAYADTLRITRNQYNAGTTDASALAEAQAQLDTAQASLINVGVLRAQYEHAIAVLAGEAPAELSIPKGVLTSDVPVAPGVVPSLLLQRRPDISAAERTMASQNALIGVQIAAFYPDISLSTLAGFEGNVLGKLISAANKFWSIGANATETIFEGGLRNSEVAAARAAYDASVASYRQTVLTAFQQVEDELVALRILEQQEAAAQTAVASSQRAVQVVLNTYLAGTAAYTAVVTQQTVLLTNQETALAVQEQRLVASVTLVQALGGGWSTLDLPSRGSFQKGLPFLKY